jgi:hypothetical protein
LVSRAEAGFVFKEREMIRTVCVATAIGALAGFAGGSRADTLVLNPNHDNSMFAELTSNSNGAGNGVFAGLNLQGNARRGLMSFDLSSIPAGSTITGATLTMFVTQSSGGGITVDLHRVLASWGEGTSNGAGQGAAATAGDATWLHRSFNTDLWASPGGDFAAAASASKAVGAVGSYSWSGGGMMADLQAWLSNPAGNFGWLIRGDETVAGAAKRFGSREIAAADQRPMLTIDYTPVPAPGVIGVVAAGIMVVRVRRNRKPERQ